MRSDEERRAIQDRLLEVHDQVERELTTIAGVQGVGVGLKERGGEITDEICFRVYVSEKLAAGALAPEHVVPKEIAGFPTDVITIYTAQPQQTSRIDLSEHSVLTGGVAISTEVSGHYYGTLGWFATDESDGSVVLLTNDHIIYPPPDHVVSNTSPKDGDRVTQPFHEQTCCCHSNVIGNNVVSCFTLRTDAALAKLDGSRPVNPVLANKTSPTPIKVVGHAAAVIGETVRKVGATSGLTEGIVVDIGAVVNTEQPIALPSPPFPAGSTVKQRKYQIIIRPGPNETFVRQPPPGTPPPGPVAFTDEGDSGSVVINKDNKIVGLLHGNVKEWPGFGIANNINDVLDALETKGHKIKLAVSPSDGSSGIASDFGSRRVRFAVAEFPILERLERADAEELLKPLIARHRAEIMNLVNHRRAVTVAWHRNRGPTFLAALARSAKEPAYRIPDAIDGIRRGQALRAFVAVLEANASEELRADIEAHGAWVIDAFARNDTLDGVIGDALGASRTRAEDVFA